MAKTQRVAILLLAVSLSACAPKGPVPKTLVLNDFERVPDPALSSEQFDPVEAIKKPTYPKHDFDVTTWGYAALEAYSKEEALQRRDKALYDFVEGKSAARVRFSVPGDYEGSIEHAQWETGFALATDSSTPLKASDWTPYTYLNFRVFNPGEEQLLYVRYTDAASRVTSTAVALPQGESEVELPLAQLREARMNAADLRRVDFYLDTVKLAKDPELLFDQVALYNMDAAARQKLASEEGAAEEEQDFAADDEGAQRQVRLLKPGAPAPAANPAK